jgi:hypothetical protein
VETPLARPSVQFSLLWNSEGAEPGSTNVDGSYRASSPTKVRDIMRTLLTREERAFYPKESRWVNCEARQKRAGRGDCARLVAVLHQCTV